MVTAVILSQFIVVNLPTKKRPMARDDFFLKFFKNCVEEVLVKGQKRDATWQKHKYVISIFLM